MTCILSNILIDQPQVFATAVYFDRKLKFVLFYRVCTHLSSFFYACAMHKNVHLIIHALLLLCFRDMPSSFTGSYGKTVYSLKARLGRSMRIDKKDSININFVTKDLCIDPELKVCGVKSSCLSFQQEKKMCWLNN